MKVSQFILGVMFGAIGARFALGAGGAVELDAFDHGLVAAVCLFMAHTVLTTDIEPDADE